MDFYPKGKNHDVGLSDLTYHLFIVLRVGPSGALQRLWNQLFLCQNRSETALQY